MSYQILCIDDDAEFLLGLKIQLKGSYKVLTAQTMTQGLTLLAEKGADLVFLDVNLGEENGLSVLKKITTEFPDVDVVMVSGERDPKLIVDAVREGASDYICKPFAADELFAVVEKMLKLRSMRDRQGALIADIKAKELAKPLIGGSKKFEEILKRAECVRGHNANVLIEGESGTGKELLARFIHELEGNPDRPFIAVNCAAIPENLIESELFGHEKGSFSGAFQRRVGKFELANHGDIFLDEINSLKPDLQAKILRTIQEKEIYRVGGNHPIHISFRVIAATNSDLEDMVCRKSFRIDLFHRLRVVSLRIPPLRERPEDIPVLVGHFLQKYGLGKKRFSEKAIERFVSYSWPGNVRELENLVHSLVIMSPSPKIGEQDLPIWLKEKSEDTTWDAMDPKQFILPAVVTGDAPEDRIVPLKRYVQSIEKRYVQRALLTYSGDKSKAALALGISRTSLYEKMKGEDAIH